MKKIFLLSITSFVFCAFAYTSSDIANTNYLTNQGVVVRQTTEAAYRLDDRILRQEVVAMVLRIKGINVPENYMCKQYYADVTNNGWVCAAIETAADNGIITRENTRARPRDFVTRAEALTMLLKTGKITLSDPRRIVQSDGSIWSLYQDLRGLGFTQWQADMMDSLPSCLIINHGISCEDGADMNTAIAQFRPNISALRSQVFEFAAIMYGFIGGDDTRGILDDLDILLPQVIVPSQTSLLPQDPNRFSTETLRSLLKDEPIETLSPLPKVALIVFSDFECPFCAKLFQDVIAPVIADTSTNTALIYKNYVLPYHTHSPAWAIEAECVAKNLGSKAYFDYVRTRYEDQDASVYDISADLTTAQMTACLTDDIIAQRIALEYELGTLYQVSAVPTTLVVNTSTGYYETIVGAYPKTVFDTAIQNVKDHQ